MCQWYNATAALDDDEIDDLGMYAANKKELQIIRENARRIRVDPDLARGREFQRQTVESYFDFQRL